jgi:hypothetical protein
MSSPHTSVLHGSPPNIDPENRIKATHPFSFPHLPTSPPRSLHEEGRCHRGAHFPFVLVLCRPLVFDIVIWPCLCRGRVRGECEFPAWQFLDQSMVVVYTFERVTRHQDDVMRRFDETRKSLTATEGARSHLCDIGCWRRRGSRCTMMVFWWWEKWLLSQRAVFGASHKVGDAARSL